MAKVSDPALKAVVEEIRSDSNPTTWCVFGYEGKSKIVKQASGSGDIDEWRGHLKEDEAQYSLVRLVTGDQESKRVKFVFVTWIGPSLSVMKKARVNTHKGDVVSVIGQHHVEFHTDDMDEITEKEIRGKLKRSGGADYDLGSNSRDTTGTSTGYSSQAGNIKAASKSAYKEKEKSGTLTGAVYDKYTVKGAKMTPCDISGRPTVASNSEAKKNTSASMGDGTGKALNDGLKPVSESEKKPEPEPEKEEEPEPEPEKEEEPEPEPEPEKEEEPEPEPEPEEEDEPEPEPEE